MAVFSLFLVLFRQDLRFPQAFCLLPVGVLAIWLCNVVRITALILVGAYGSPEIAVGGFHSQAVDEGPHERERAHDEGEEGESK